VEVRVYETSGELSLLVGVPALTVKRSLTNADPTVSNVAVADPPTQPLNIEIPMLEIVRQGYIAFKVIIGF
jgi:Protein of unknown function (DUF4058)